ncbi:MAG: 23S rRNA (adenine(2503)-C(2))-methyltransferase RlmN [Chlorobium sp.]|nr:MAG: 23S rRNA (adenine(2503)-C(2))-methyltransferase RlmN [Chlorobium sp.]
MTSSLPNIKDLTLKELQQLMTSHGEPLFRATQIHQWLFSHHAESFDDMTILSLAFRRKLSETFSIERPEIVEHLTGIEEACDYQTEKILLKLPDGNMVESVLIPSAERLTACVSTQVGCPLNCHFCATGKMGFQRNLSAGEITEQVYTLNNLVAAKESGKAITNIVFMGMGEPLLNTDNVIEAIETFSSRNYRFCLSQKRVTISTVGVIPEIQRLGKSGLKTKLAVSLHSANQEKRELLMPIAARQYPLQELGKTLAEYTASTGSPVTIVYMLLKGINDSLDDAKMLARFSRSFLCKINLIDYNSIINIKFMPVFSSTKELFQQYLVNAGLHVTIRKSFGTTINAACGQLATTRYTKPQ